MAERPPRQMVDAPHFNPDERIAFPPTENTLPSTGPRRPAQPPKPVARPYHETYDPDPRSPDPSQTTPGAPDIRNGDIPDLSPEELKALSPDVDLSAYEKTARA